MGFVPGTYKTVSTGTTATTLTTPSSTMTTGNTVFVIVNIFNSTLQSVATLGDGTNPYTLVTRTAATYPVFNGLDVEIWMASNITGGTRGVTATWSNGGGGSNLSMAEYSGVAITGTINDANAFNSGGGNQPLVTYAASPALYWNDLIIASASAQQASVWTDSGYGTPTDRTGAGGLGWGDITTTTSTASLRMLSTVTTNGEFVITSAAFRLPSGAPVYDWINAGTGVQLPVVGLTPANSAPGSPDASMLFTSPDMVSTPVQSEIPAAPINFTSPVGPISTPVQSEIPSVPINFTSPVGPIGTPTTGEMPTGQYFLQLNMFGDGFTGVPWLNNVFILGQEFWDKTTTIYNGQLYPVPESNTAEDSGGSSSGTPSTLGQLYPTASKRRRYPY